MKLKFFGVGLMLALLAVFAPMQSVGASAYTSAFQVAVTYQNVGTAATPVSVTFYKENDATAIPFTISSGTPLAAGASSSLLIGTVDGLGTTFKGSGIMSAQQPIVATIVQFATGVAVRPLSNGFSSGDGSSTQLVATVLKNKFNNTTSFAVQNVEDTAVDVTVKYYGVDDSGNPTGLKTTQTANGLPSGASKYFDSGLIDGLGQVFNGSAVVTAKKAGGADAKTVITVNELDTVGNGAKSFEGTGQSGTTVYMPSALCNFTALRFTHAYAVQNAATVGSVTFNVTYKAAGKADVVDGPYTLTPGGKKSILGCTKLPDNYIGAAVISRTAGTGTLVAVGKVSGGGITSAFLGSTAGAAKLALPYVRWSPDSTFSLGSRQRANIAIQNIGATAANNVTIKYIDRDGKLIQTVNLGTIASGAKANSNPGPKTATNPNGAGAVDACGRFGEYGGGADCLGTAFGGGALVSGDSGAQLIAVVRITNGGAGALTTAGEDYNGIVAP